MTKDWSWKFKKKQTIRLASDPFRKPKFETYKVDWSKLVVIDFETYYDDEYSLTKLSTSEYVRDSRFKVQMMGIKIGRGKTRIIPGNKVKAELAKIDWTQYSLLCHNTQFDGFILSDRFGVHPKFLFDSLSMARGLLSNDIGAGLDEVSIYFGGKGKIADVLESTKGIKDWPADLFKKAGVYCANDTDECLRVFQCMLPDYPAEEIELIDLTCRMFCRPLLKVDIPRVQAELQRELKRRDDLFTSIIDVDKYDNKTTRKNPAERALTGKDRVQLIVKRVIGSNEKFAELLRAEGVEPPVKISPAWMKKPAAQRTEEDKYAYAFAKDDQAFLDLAGFDFGLDLEDPKQVEKLVAKQQRIQDLIDCRIATKSTSNITRSERFLTAGAGGASLPCGYAYYRAHTGRWGGQNKMNMQNLRRGGELRLSILAPRGHVLSVVDSGQIEARVNGWLWGQDDLMAAFAKADKWDKAKGTARGNDRDAYCKFADLIYGREITTEDKLERFVGKVCVLGLGFQMGAAKLQMTLAKGALGGPPVNFSLAKCRSIVDTYRSVNDKISLGWRICNQIIEDMAAGVSGSWGPISWEKDTVWLPNGMRLKYPGLKKAKSEDSGWDEWTYQAKDMRKKIYGGLLCENIVQALARIIVAMQMLAISKRAPVVMTTHDEVVACVRSALGASTYKFMHKCMSTPLPWCKDIPLNCEGGFAVNYSK